MSTFYSGKNGRVKLNSNFQTFKTWKLKQATKLYDATNFESPSDGLGHYEEWLTTFLGGEITLQGPLDPTIGMVVGGGSYPVELTVGSTYKFTLSSFLVETVEIGQDAKGAAEWTVTGKITGSFNANLA